MSLVLGTGIGFQKKVYSKVYTAENFSNFVASALGGGGQRPMSVDGAYSYTEKLLATNNSVRMYAPSDPGVAYNCYCEFTIPSMNLDKYNAKLSFFNDNVNYSSLTYYLYDSAGNYRSWTEDNLARRYGLNIRNIDKNIAYNTQSVTPPDFTKLVKLRVRFGMATGATFGSFIVDGIEINKHQPKLLMCYLDDIYYNQKTLIDTFYSTFGYYFPFTMTPNTDFLSDGYGGEGGKLGKLDIIDIVQNKGCGFAPQFVADDALEADFEAEAFNHWNYAINNGLLQGSTYNLTTHSYDNPELVNDNFHCSFDGGVNWNATTLERMALYNIKTGRSTNNTRKDFDNRVKKYQLPLVETNNAIPSTDILGKGGGIIDFYYHDCTTTVINTFIANYATLYALGYRGITIDDYYRQYLQ